MTTLTRIQVRPNASVEFYYKMSLEARQNMFVKFQGANPTLLQNNIEISSDLLTWIHTLVFTTSAAALAFQADADVIADQDAKIAYCSANNITVSEAMV